MDQFSIYVLLQGHCQTFLEKKTITILNYSASLETYCSKCISFVHYFCVSYSKKHVFENKFFRKFDFYPVYLYKVEAAFLAFCLLLDCKPLNKISKKLE